MTLTLPDGAVKYAQTKTFTETTVPKSLLRDHSTKPNSWGLIVVETGTLIYTRIEQPEQVVEVGSPGVIVPAELHKIATKGAVRFHVEFYHDPDADTSHRDNEKVAI